MTGPAEHPASGGEPQRRHRPGEVGLAEAFVALTDSLLDDFDVIDVLHVLAERCVQFCPVDAAGALLLDQRGGVASVAATSMAAEQLGLFEVRTGRGPCAEAVAGGAVVVCDDLAREGRWPRFGGQATALGIVGVAAVPLRARQEVIGALALYSADVRLDEDGLRIGQALADVTATGILAWRAMQHGMQVTEQLQTALNNRVVIEQAKGKLAHVGDRSPEEVFAALRSYARAHNRRLSDLALEILDGRLPPGAVLDDDRSP